MKLYIFISSSIYLFNFSIQHIYIFKLFIVYIYTDANKLNSLYILGWWKINAFKYPIIAEITRDVFAIHIFTVVSESAFSTGGRVLDCFRSSLSQLTATALICTQN